MAITQKVSKDIVVDYYTDYSRYVATSRAIPALMDGFKPVQRRFIVAARDLRLWSHGPTLKSAKIAGEVSGNYHPHGNAYGALANMVQDFKMRYPLFIGQGNWGCADLPGSVAAERYTEAKLSKFTEDFYLQDAEYGDYQPNYDGRLQELILMYPVLPGCLITGNSGIASGISTNIPMHRLIDLAKSMLVYLNDPNSEEYLEHLIPETAEKSVILSSRDEIKELYRKGEGSIKYEARMHYETIDGKPALVVDAFPPEYSKKRLETKPILEAVEKGILELNNASKTNIRYEFISSDPEVLRSIESRLVNTVNYRFYIEHRGVIKKYSLKEIYDTFLEERKTFIIRKYTDLLSKSQFELDYYNVLVLLKQDKQYIKDMFDKTSDIVIQDIMTKYNTTEEIARRVINTSLRSLMADNLAEIQAKIAKLQNDIAKYTTYVNDPEIRIREDIDDILRDYANDEKRAVLKSELKAKNSVTFKGEDIPIEANEMYLVATPDNQITQVSGNDLLHNPDPDQYVAIVPANKKYYLAWDDRGIVGMERETLLKSGNKFSSDKLVGLLAVDDLKEIEVTHGNGKVEQLQDWCLRKRASYIRLSDDSQPPVKVRKV